jgi:hypothetical protein
LPLDTSDIPEMTGEQFKTAAHRRLHGPRPTGQRGSRESPPGPAPAPRRPITPRARQAGAPARAQRPDRPGSQPRNAALT